MNGWVKVLLAFLAFLVLCGLLGLALHQIFNNSTPGVDLYVFWVAGRALIVEGRDPYALDVNQAIQLGIYGHLLQPGEDPMYFAYPPYALIPVWPLLRLTFDWIQAFWLSFNLLALALCLRFSLPHAQLWTILLTFLFYPIVFGLVLGNFAILLAAILLLCLGRLVLPEKSPARAEQMILGLLLAWATAKPQFIWFFALLIGFNALRRRQLPFLIGLGSGLILVLVFSFMILPDWPALWLNRLSEYARDDPANSPLQDYLGIFFPGQLLPLAVYAAGAAILLVSAWLFYRWLCSRLPILPLLAWGGAATFLLNPNGRAYEHIPLLISLIVWTGLPDTRIRSTAVIFTSYVAATWILFGLSHQYFRLAADRGTFLLFIPWIVALFAQKTPITDVRLSVEPDNIKT